MVTIKAKSKPAVKPRVPEFVRDRNAVDTYCAEIKQYQSLTRKEEQALALEIQAGSKPAMRKLVEANLKFVLVVCRHYAGRGLPIGDLINEGNLGLMRAASRFDAGLEFKFISYAVWWIRQGILTALAEQSRVLNVPAGRVDAISKIGLATGRLEQRLGRSPSVEEVAAETGKTAEAVIACRRIAAAPLSLDAPTGVEGEASFGERLEDENAEKTDRGAMLHLLGRSVEAELTRLGTRERLVIRMYFGIGSDASHTLTDIGLRLNLTRERVRQIKLKALLKLRTPMKRAGMASEMSP